MLGKMVAKPFLKSAKNFSRADIAVEELPENWGGLRLNFTPELIFLKLR